MSESKLKRRRLLADLLFVAGWLTIAALLTLPQAPPAPTPSPSPLPAVYPQYSSNGSLLP